MRKNEHPIIFSAPMVRAIIDGRKTHKWRHLNRDCGQAVDRIWMRIERLQDISNEDAIAEGAQQYDVPMGRPSATPNRWSMESPANTDQCLSSPRWAFANYWDKINGEGSWDSNPFVVVIGLVHKKE